MTRTCIVRHKTRSNFTVIRNELLTDVRLSWKALGLITYSLCPLNPNKCISHSHEETDLFLRPRWS